MEFHKHGWEIGKLKLGSLEEAKIVIHIIPIINTCSLLIALSITCHPYPVHTGLCDVGFLFKIPHNY